MTVAALFPSPGEVEASTPATRDRAIDVLRIVSLVAVVVGHTIMATRTLRNGVFIWRNLLTTSPVFQVMVALLAARRRANDTARVCPARRPASVNSTSSGVTD